jgi:guanine deaminase
MSACGGRGGLGYAITPRFAVTSSEAQLAMAGELAAAHPEALVQTHILENRQEIAEVGRLFPGARDYLDVYDRFGLVTARSVFAHCVHAGAGAFDRLARAEAAVAFCPSSNLMLGSGAFDLQTACACGVKVALATDVGGGASFSMPRMIGEAYRVGRLRGETLDPLHGFYLATLAGARALRLDDKIGNLAPGKEADFLVLDPTATPLLARRLAGARSLGETVFALAILGDDRIVQRTYLRGRLAHARDSLDPSPGPAGQSAHG